MTMTLKQLSEKMKDLDFAMLATHAPEVRSARAR